MTMGKSLIYSANETPQVLEVGDTINFGSIVRRYGCNLFMSGGNIIAKGEGYYKVGMNTTVLATEAGVLTVRLYKNGVAIPGATTSKTVGVGSTYSITIAPVAIRNACCSEDVITASISNVGATINNASILVERS